LKYFTKDLFFSLETKRIHSKLPCKKLLERHYIIDSRVIPASRCIFNLSLK